MRLQGNPSAGPLREAYAHHVSYVLFPGAFFKLSDIYPAHNIDTSIFTRPVVAANLYEKYAQ
ncbi:MAG: hypothetical protein A2270_10865 [Elusimicrobia bacterium RIFOXYA12_FULL_51_18]|nr:MAG: hypothetical protein A2270_10865 [Elusimicrobia bacterium RIFOXYA12_FULL_51_18]